MSKSGLPSRSDGGERADWNLSKICGVFRINFPESGPPYGSNLEHGEFKNQNFLIGFFLNKSWVSEFTGKNYTIIVRSIFRVELKIRIFFCTLFPVMVPNIKMWESSETGFIEVEGHWFYLKILWNPYRFPKGIQWWIKTNSEKSRTLNFNQTCLRA